MPPFAVIHVFARIIYLFPARIDWRNWDTLFAEINTALHIEIPYGSRFLHVYHATLHRAGRLF